MTVDRTPAHLSDMLRFVRELRSLVAPPMTAQAFEAQRILCLAVEKRFINLGEAAYRVDAVRAQELAGIRGGRSLVFATSLPTDTSR